MKRHLLGLAIIPVALLSGCAVYDPYYDPPLAPYNGVYSNVPGDVSVTFGTYTPYYNNWYYPGFYPVWGDYRWRDYRWRDYRYDDHYNRGNWNHSVPRNDNNWRWNGMQNRPSAPNVSTIPQNNRNYGGYGASRSWQRSNSGQNWNH